MKAPKSLSGPIPNKSGIAILITAVYIIISIEIIIGTFFALRSDYRVILLKL